MYDDGGVTSQRYTAFFSGLFDLKKPGEYTNFCMRAEPLAPDGSYALRRSRPPYNRMGCEISFDKLLEGCKRLVVDVYRDLWGLRDAEGAA